MGIDIVWVKAFTLAVGAAIAALGGGLLAHYILVQGQGTLRSDLEEGAAISVSPSCRRSALHPSR